MADPTFPLSTWVDLESNTTFSVVWSGGELLAREEVDLPEEESPNLVLCGVQDSRITSKLKLNHCSKCGTRWCDFATLIWPISLTRFGPPLTDR